MDRVVTVGGHTIESTTIGRFEQMNIRVGVSEDFRVNILSLSEVEDKAAVDYVQGEYFEVRPFHKSKSYRFIKDDRTGLYIRRFGQNRRANVEVLSTVAERRSELPSRRLVEADRAWEFITNANVSKVTAIKMATQSADLHGCNVSRQAILDAFAIYGADVPQLKGKTRRTTASTATMSADTTLPGVQTIYADVMHIRDPDIRPVSAYACDW